MKKLFLVFSVVAIAGGCSPTSESSSIGELQSPSVLGSKVTIQVVVKGSGLNKPTDVEVDPNDPNILWVVNSGDNTFLRVTLTPQPDGSVTAETQKGAKDSQMGHFLAKPYALAFAGNTGTAATAQNADIVPQGQPGNSIMGITLWSSDLINASSETHLDMLHNSQLSTGIAWAGFPQTVGPAPLPAPNLEQANRFWVFDGKHRAISRYDFGLPHAPGADDHGDGEVMRYVTGVSVPVATNSSVGTNVFTKDAEGSPVYQCTPGKSITCFRFDEATLKEISEECSCQEVPATNGPLHPVKNTASHIAYHPESRTLYVADTGAGRILRYDTTKDDPTRRWAICPNIDSWEDSACPMQHSDDPSALLEVTEDIRNEMQRWRQEAGLTGLYQEPQYAVTAEPSVLVESAAVKTATGATMHRPSGLEIYKQHLYITDNESGHLLVFDLEGNPVAALAIDTDERLLGLIKSDGRPTILHGDLKTPGSLMGLTIANDDAIYLVDYRKNQLLRVTQASP